MLLLRRLMDAHRSAAASSVYVLAALAASALIALGACGGTASSVESNGTSGGSGGGTSGGGGGGDIGLISKICPTVLPATGSACLGATSPGNSCEYGGEGERCTSDGQECDYTRVCDAVSLGLPDLKCVAGFWEDQKKPQPPCPAPQCAK